MKCMFSVNRGRLTSLMIHRFSHVTVIERHLIAASVLSFRCISARCLVFARHCSKASSWTILGMWTVPKMVERLTANHSNYFMSACVYSCINSKEDCRFKAYFIFQQKHKRKLQYKWEKHTENGIIQKQFLTLPSN